MQDLHAVGKPTQTVQLARRLAELSGQIYSGDMAPVFGGDPPRWPADATADVEDVIARLWLQRRGKLLGLDRAPPVKVVDRRESVGCDTSGPCTFRSAVSTRAATPSFA
jgi:hypothetical protein